MKKMQSLLCACVLAGITATASAAGCVVAGNILVDPSFEMQTPAALGGWDTTLGGVFSDVANGGYARSGNHSLDISAYFSVAQATQQFPAAPGSRWKMTGYGFIPNVPLNGGPDFGIVQIIFLDYKGSALASVETTGNVYPAKVSAAMAAGSSERNWTSLDTGIATAAPGTVYVQANVMYGDFSGYSGQRVLFDDVNLRVLRVTHREYVSSIARNAETLKRAGLITSAQQQAMVQAADRSNGGIQQDCEDEQ